eukprot:11824688-Heterocapsa_arctica.AAC.2
MEYIPCGVGLGHEGFDQLFSPMIALNCSSAFFLGLKKVSGGTLFRPLSAQDSLTLDPSTS